MKPGYMGKPKMFNFLLCVKLLKLQKMDRKVAFTLQNYREDQYLLK